MIEATFGPRPGTFDEYIIKEVFRDEVYKRLEIAPGDVVLDVGANIGAFSVYAGLEGAEVKAFEAHPTNHAICEKHVELNEISELVSVYHAAVVGRHDVGPVPFYVTNRSNQGLHSLVRRFPDEIEIEVPSVPLAALIDGFKPDSIKMDIEGGEWECLYAVEDWGSVTQLIFEYHNGVVRSMGIEDGEAKIEALLSSHFDVFEMTPERGQVSMGYAART